jgi:hypothetical protein
VLTVAEFLLKVCYSPAAFTFADELLHWRSTVNILQTGKLFTVNYGLPISPQYPGLEEVTTALVSTTGLSVFTAGLIVTGVAHLLLVCILYLLYREVSRSYRTAGIAALIFSSTPDLSTFNSMFVYETLALTFLGLSILASWRTTTDRISTRERVGWFTIAVLAIMATVITHHVTSYMLVATLIIVTLASLLAGYWRPAAYLAILALISAAAVVCWVVFIAPDTLSYFRPTVDGVLQGVNALQSGGSANAPPTSAAPQGNRALEGLAILAISALLPVGWWQVWRRFRHQPWVIAMAIGSLGWYVALALRIGTADGQELAGRTAVFVYIPVGLILALVLARLVTAPFLRRWQSAVIAAGLAAVLALLFDGLVNGWPPFWERLPGPHQVAGFERSVGPEEIAAAQWTLSALGSGNRFAADIGIYPVLAGYGYQNPLQDIGYLYTSPEYTPSDERLARAQAVHYVVVDRRLGQSLPASGTYFPGESYTGTRPLPIADLTKFDHVPGIARIYDSGNIVIYDLEGWPHAP